MFDRCSRDCSVSSPAAGGGERKRERERERERETRDAKEGERRERVSLDCC